MTGYTGPAVLMVEDAEIAVEAELRTERSGGTPGWCGSLSAAPSEDFWVVVQSRGGKIRLPSGKEGDFIPGHTSIGSGQLIITGTGSPPF